MVTDTNANLAHPLDPLTAREIKLAADTVRAFMAKGQFEGAPASPLFNSISLLEPPKYDILRWAGTFTPKELAAVGAEPKPITRQADIHIICNKSNQAFECVVDLPSNLKGENACPDPKVSSWTLLEKDIHPSLQTEELLWAEDICRADPKVKEACDAVGLKQSDIYVDGWCIAHDERYPGRRLQQCFIFARSRPGDNLYAHPCDFIPILDSNTGEILTIDYPHSHSTTDKHSPSGADAYAKAAPRERFAPPKANHNYLPEQIMQDEPNFKLREGLKPLHVIQPEGVSYSLSGRQMSWQNWNFHIGFNYREGLVISNVTYDDGARGTRPMFYRMSIAEMVVPYASTIYPHHRKHAFDTGEYGVGALANSLALGCDCLGSISYMDAEFVTRNGGIQTIKNAICIHEEDAGLLHKHTDFRDNVAHSARNRKLVVSMICTVANYEYGFYFNFALDGSIELEVKATGMVNAYPLAPGEKANSKIEVEVAPRIAAQHHQHLFSYRIDPMIDGLQNRVVQVDAVQDAAPVGSDENFYGNGFHTEKKVYKTSKDACSDYDARSSRVWSIENPNKLHYATGNPIGYKIKCKDMPPLLAKPGSMVWNRAPWARHNMFVTTFRNDELFPSDVHINQNPGCDKFGLQNWVDRNDSVDNADVVCWPMFGVTHISRPEDWPIMPVEILRCHVVPNGFFDRHPGLDIPSKKDMKSRNADEAFVGNAPYANGNGTSNGNGVAANGGGCCNGGA